jgi:hypothetical protein
MIYVLQYVLAWVLAIACIKHKIGIDYSTEQHYGKVIIWVMICIPFINWIMVGSFCMAGLVQYWDRNASFTKFVGFFERTFKL